MKNLTLAIIAVILSGCNMNQLINPGQTTAATLLWDKTDTLLSKPEIEVIQKDFELSDKSRGAVFKLLPISDVEFNYTYTHTLEAKPELLTNPMERKAKIKDFYREVSNSLEQIDNAPVGMGNSQIFSVVMREAQELAKQDVDRKVLYVYSDLREHSGVFCAYNPKDLADLKDNREQVVSKFKRQFKVGDVTGVEIHFIYQAEHFQDSEAFNLMSGLYKTILEEAGAQVLISAN